MAETPVENGHLPLTEVVRWNHRLKWYTKLFFALGGIPYQMTGTAIAFFFAVFLLEIAQMDPYLVSVIVFVGKGWDAITDPVIGYLVNKTRTRFGKLKPWIFTSTPFACVIYFFLWYVPDISEAGKVGYYLVIYCLFQASLTCLHVPYSSLTMYLTDDHKERDSATAYRMLFEILGVVLAVGIQGPLINLNRKNACKADSATPSPQNIEDQKTFYMLSSGILAGIYLLCVLFTVCGVHENRDYQHDDHEPFCTSYKVVFTHGPYVKLTFAFMFISLAIQIVQGNLTLFLTHTLNVGDNFDSMILVLLGTAILCIPFWQFILKRYGKKTAFAWGMIIMIPIFYSMLFFPPDEDGSLVWLVYIVMAIAGSSISVAYLLPWSMLPDVLDDFLLKTGHRKDAIFYSFYVFFNKLAVGLSVGLSQVALGIGQYNSKSCDQPESVALTLRLLVAPVPIVCILIGLMFLWRYPITEERRKMMMQQLATQNEGLSPNGDMSGAYMRYETIEDTC